MKTKASVLPLVIAMGLMVASLGMPWMTAKHYIDISGKKEVADSWVYYLWGQTYTVSGAKMMQSNTDIYDYRDFPFIGMLLIIIALGIAAFSLLSGRGTVLHIRGKEFKFRSRVNAVYLLIVSAVLLYISWMYMRTAPVEIGLIHILERKDYVPEFGPGLDFILGSFMATVVATTMTFLRARKDAELEALVN